MWRSKRAFNFNTQPVDGGTTTYSLSPGMVESGFTISAPYSANVTAVGLAVRVYPLPVRRVIVADKFGNTLHIWRARDLVPFAQIYEQTPLAAQFTGPSGFAIANYTGLICHLHLTFDQIGPKISPEDGMRTGLPTFAYGKDGLLVTVEWGSVTDLLTGTPTGTITFGPASAAAGAPIIEQIDYADLRIPNPRQFASQMDIAVNRYKEISQAAATANAALELPLDTDANIRALMLIQETANGEPTETLVDTVTMTEDNVLSPYVNRPWATIKAENAKHFGLTMPTGIVVIDFAEDGNVDRDAIYRAVDKNKVSLFFKTEAVIGTVRAAMLTIKPPRQF